jgi:hypothetical protein
MLLRNLAYKCRPLLGHVATEAPMWLGHFMAILFRIHGSYYRCYLKCCPMLLGHTLHYFATMLLLESMFFGHVAEQSYHEMLPRNGT